MHKNKALIAPLGLVGITILSGVFLMSSYSHATSDNIDAVDDVSITVPVSCSMEGTGMNSHNANIVNGTYQADIGSTTLKVFCNDEEGFAIYAIGFTDDEYGKTVLTNSTLGSTYDIATGTATSGSTSNWAMKLATNTSATYALTLDNGFGSYSSAPATYTKVAHRDNGTDIGTGTTGASLTTTYAAFVSQTQPAGTYSGKVKYTLVHPSSVIPAPEISCEVEKICYDPNTAIVEGQMGQQELEIERDWNACWEVVYDEFGTFCLDENGDEVDPETLPVLNYYVYALYASNYKRNGYGFAGWSDVDDYATNPNAHFYGPNQAMTFSSSAGANGIHLYAVWVESAGTLQNWSGCSSLTQAPINGTANLSSVTALTDGRDNNTYAIAKLADGKCWMIENLRLDNTPELSSLNTHNPSLPLTNVYDTGSTSNHLSPTTSIAYDASTAPEGWCYAATPSCVNQSRLRTDNTTLFTSNTANNYDAEGNVYSYGNYYNWYSVTAGHGQSTSGSGYVALGDICPVGWRLPTGGNSADYSVLDVAMGGRGDGQASSEGCKRWRSYPVNYVYAGGAGVQISERNVSGEYWTSSSGNYGVYELLFYEGIIDPGTSGTSKPSGLNARCVAGV